MKGALGKAGKAIGGGKGVGTLPPHTHTRGLYCQTVKLALPTPTSPTLFLLVIGVTF